MFGFETAVVLLRGIVISKKALEYPLIILKYWSLVNVSSTPNCCSTGMPLLGSNRGLKLLRGSYAEGK